MYPGPNRAGRKLRAEDQAQAADIIPAHRRAPRKAPECNAAALEPPAPLRIVALTTMTSLRQKLKITHATMARSTATVAHQVLRHAARPLWPTRPHMSRRRSNNTHGAYLHPCHALAPAPHPETPRCPPVALVPRPIGRPRQRSPTRLYFFETEPMHPLSGARLHHPGEQYACRSNRTRRSRLPWSQVIPITTAPSSAGARASSCSCIHSRRYQVLNRAHTTPDRP